MKLTGEMPAIWFLIAAAVLEAGGDAVLRLAIFRETDLLRLLLFCTGAALLFAYGTFLNLAPLEFGQVAGAYIATLLIVWQVINLLVFRTWPDMATLAGGTLIVAGGLVMTLWTPAV